MALLDPSSWYDLAASMFDNIPTNFIPEEDLLFHHDFNLLPPPQPLFFDHHSSMITTPPDSYYDMIHLHADDHYIQTTTIIPTPVDSSYDFHFDSDLYSHHHPGTELAFEDSTFFPPLPRLYLPQQDAAPQLQDEPPHKSSHYPSNCTIPPPPPPPPFHHFSPNYANTVAASDLDDTLINAGCYNKEKGRQRRRPTAQSIAARERRKRISDKTQELARLLPAGAAKMNTAEMLQNAFTYVKFLQAQVHLLQLMDSPHSNSFQEQNLQLLMSSSAVQEKLYTNHKCLVPLEFLTHLAQDLPHLTKDLTQFLTIHSTL